MITRYIRIQGVVQGVGFRPFVYALAQRFHLNGWVLNSSRGVEIEVTGDAKTLDAFISALNTEAPPLAHITGLTTEERPLTEYDAFTIRTSEDTGGVTLVSPDIALCDDCAREMADPTDRRHHYPFINCTNCGPRYSIITRLPYDRPFTTMQEFTLCDNCRTEYNNPSDRRFHAQPNACPVCGPHVFAEDLSGDDAIQEAARRIDAGEVVAVRGLGGYHLICDATNDRVVETLRLQKMRKSKPFAIMVKDVETLRKYRTVTDAEERFLRSPQAPIILLPWTNPPLSQHVAPLISKIGVMLAYTPLHRLLMEACKTDFIIATSGNRREEPVIKDISDAEEKLRRFTRFFLHHNRPIHTRVDDSVATVVNDQFYSIRRARGFAPYPVMLPISAPKPILALGAHLKSTITLVVDNYAFVSQYLGDLDNPETNAFFTETVDKMKRLFGVNPDIIVCDTHPGYTSTRYAEALSRHPVKIQHHHAHMASCMAENGLTDNVIGVIFDGTGLGEDGTIWGGEFFTMQNGTINRVAHLAPAPMPGGDAAVKNPSRMLAGYLHQYGMLQEYRQFFSFRLHMPEGELNLLSGMIDKGVNSPLSSGMGRLFEAVGSIVTGIKSNEYEGHSAVIMEGLIDRHDAAAYEFEDKNGVITLRRMFEQLLRDLKMGIPASVMSSRFHNGVTQMIASQCAAIRDKSGLNDVVLSGGVFQNITLLESASALLKRMGFSVHIHSRVPANDGAVSLGQAYLSLLNSHHQPLS